jgi:hypothetical protein
METMKNIIVQELNEMRFNRKHIDKKIRTAIEESTVMVTKLIQGIKLVTDYLAGDYYESKMKRLAQLDNLDVPELVMDVFVGIAYAQRPELFTSVSAQMAARLKFSDRTEAITTVAELMAVLCQTDAFDITKADRQASLMVVSRIPLSEELVKFIMNSQYLPPMVCEPLELTHNYSSGYLTHNDSLILGSGNHHDGDICLDALNTISKVALKLDMDLLLTEEELPTEITIEKMKVTALKKGKTLTEAEAKERVRLGLLAWSDFKKQSNQFYLLMQQQGNQFYLNHKVDKRGRVYASGYHITTQGTSFKKASIELAREELVEGVPV